MKSIFLKKFFVPLLLLLLSHSICGHENLLCNKAAKMSVNLAYYQSWAVWRNNCGIVQPENIDIKGMGYTHLVYAFASIAKDFTVQGWKGVDSEELPRMKRMNALKNTHPGLKTLIGVGGWTHNDKDSELCWRFSDAAATAANRRTFANSVLKFLKRHNFDGIDFDWEYPADKDRCGRDEDKTNYALLVETVRQKLDSDKPGYLLTMAVPINTERLMAGYNLPSLARDLDFFNVMAYDIAGYWCDLVGSHSDMRHIRDVIPYFLSEGVPSSSIVLGLGAFGRTFSLSNKKCTDVGCPFNGCKLLLLFHLDWVIFAPLFVLSLAEHSYSTLP